MAILTANQKLQITTAITNNETASNKDIAELLKTDIQGLTWNNVSGVRIHFNRGRFAYNTNLENEISEANSLSNSVLDTMNTTYAVSKLVATAKPQKTRKALDTSKGFASASKGTQKALAQQLHTDWIKDSYENYGVNKGTILANPSDSFGILEKIDKQVSNKFTYHNVENIKSVFNSMAIKMDDYGTNKSKPILGDVRDEIYNAKENAYAHILMDVYGGLRLFKKSIIHAINNDILRVGGIFAITLSLANRKKGGCDFTPKMANFIQDETKRQIKSFDRSPLFGSDIEAEVSESEVVNISFLKHFVAAMPNYELITIGTYQDKSPMLLTLIRRKY